MKRNRFMLAALLSCIVLGIFAAIGIYEVNSFKVKTPMLDMDYKIQILKDAKKHDFKNWTYNLENLRPLMGEEELTQFIKENDNNPKAYTPKAKGYFKGNLHMHSLNSDGKLSVKEILDMAQTFAVQSLPDGEYMHIAITDHNTVWGAQEVIRVLQENPGRYTRVKVAAGIETYSAYQRANNRSRTVSIHVLTWCINPYNKFLNEEFVKKNPKDKWNRTLPDRNFDSVIHMMRQHGIVGVAHPASYTAFMGDEKYQYITEMLERYKNISNLVDGGKKAMFTEAYYQTYNESPSRDIDERFGEFLELINKEATRLGIIKTGSTDMHGDNITRRY